MTKTAAQIRQEYISFFQSKQHEFVRSSPVVPHDDPTLMFTNAGMNQFKAIFLGDNPKGLKRAVNSQKCMRVSGKHNDLEEVGVDHHHHTFFEMVGNWSFGDYYKKEAITWAWELLTEVWGLDKSKLYATVYLEDDEAEELWKTETDVLHEHITRHGADNFWEMGETGPCGPCSEIHVDTGAGTCIYEDDPNHTCEVNGDECGRYVEIWNLVFMQSERQKDGSLLPLKSTHVDTGMGLERIVRIIQGGKSNYDSDLFMPIITKLEEMSGESYEHGPKGIAFRVVADHMRALTIAITDGVFPSNEGRGYVLRRLLRRAYRYGRNIGLTKPFMHQLVGVVVEMMGDAFPELRERQDFVTSVIKGEEERFDATLEIGLEKFNTMLEAVKASGSTILAGQEVFTLYDTYGFPVDLTRLMASEVGFSVDEEGFDTAMEAQKTRAREAQKGGADDGLSADGWVDVNESNGTAFVGYDATVAESKVVRYKLVTDTTALVVLDTTPFYAEMGGQCGDYGTLSVGDAVLEVVDTISWNDIVVHKIEQEAPIDVALFGHTLTATIDNGRRASIRRNHTATHLLQAALEVVLGDHVSQSGSRVDSEGLRFDFTHFAAVTKEELTEVEDLVNGWILANVATVTEEKSVEDAKAGGAKALFGEKYGDSVRVVSMGELSSELCGGTHVSATGDIGQCVITSESSVASGIRRIEATTAFGALDLARNKAATLSEATALLKVSEKDMVSRIADMQTKLKALEGDLKKLQGAAAAEQSVGIIDEAKANQIGALHFIAKSLGKVDKDSFAATADSISDLLKKQSNMAILLVGDVDGKVMLAAAATKDAVALGAHCGNIVKAAAGKVKGGGGGSPVRAQAGGKDASGIPAALEAANEVVAGI